MTELDVEVADDPSSVGRSAAARGAPVTAASRTVCQIHVLDVESERIVYAARHEAGLIVLSGLEEEFGPLGIHRRGGDG